MAINTSWLGNPWAGAAHGALWGGAAGSVIPGFGTTAGAILGAGSGLGGSLLGTYFGTPRGTRYGRTRSGGDVNTGTARYGPKALAWFRDPKNSTSDIAIKYSPFGVYKGKGNPATVSRGQMQGPPSPAADSYGYSEDAIKALQGVGNWSPQAFKAPYSLGKLDVGQFNSQDPRFMRSAQEYANATLRESLAAQQLARAQYGDLLSQQRGDEQFAMRQDIGALTGAANQQWAKIQNMGANTGLGFGPMAQQNLMTASQPFNAQMAARQLAAQNAIMGYQRTYGVNMAEATRQDALARANREANAINYLYQQILPTESDIWGTNAQAKTNAWQANAGYLNDLYGRWNEYQGLQGDAYQQRLARAQALAGIYNTPYANTTYGSGGGNSNYWATP